MTAKKSLGRGLTSLLSGEGVAAGEAAAGAAAWRDHLSLVTVSIEKLKPNPGQPRRRFEEESLQELAASIKQHGILQPILALAGKDGEFIIVAGERRWRAAAIAELRELPVAVLPKPEKDTAKVASLVENLQRRDLNPIEEALAYEALINSFGYTHEQVAQKVGKSRPYVTNALRLLELPESLRRDIENGELSAGAARLLVGRNDAVRLASKMKKEKMSVRRAEELVAKKNAAGPIARAVAQPAAMGWERTVSEALGMKVQIQGAQNGRLIIHYKGLEQLETLVETLSHPLGGRR